MSGFEGGGLVARGCSVWGEADECCGAAGGRGTGFGSRAWLVLEGCDVVGEQAGKAEESFFWCASAVGEHGDAAAFGEGF